MALLQSTPTAHKPLRGAIMLPDRVVLDIGEFKELWEAKKWEDHESMQLYIDNPFCVRKCSFCIFKSTVATPSSDIYKKVLFGILAGPTGIIFKHNQKQPCQRSLLWRGHCVLDDSYALCASFLGLFPVSNPSR